MVATDDLPLVCVGFRWPAPGFLRNGRPDENPLSGEFVCRYQKGEIEKFIKDGEGYKVARVGPLDYARMLAKIGHAFIVAEYGEDSFKPALTDLIRGRTDGAPYLVGGDDSGTPLQDQPGQLHHVYRHDCNVNGVDYILATIRLFAFMGMPRYHVVVGRKLK
jgi:hypothetical protein